MEATGIIWSGPTYKANNKFTGAFLSAFDACAVRKRISSHKWKPAHRENTRIARIQHQYVGTDVTCVTRLKRMGCTMKQLAVVYIVG